MRKKTLKKQAHKKKKGVAASNSPKTNKENQVKRPGTFFYAYYIITIIYAVYILLHSAIYLLFGQTFNLLLLPFDLVWIVAILILSIFALVMFIRHRLPKITLVVPIYHITMIGLVILLSVSLVIIAIMEEMPPPDVPGLIFVDIFTSLFELGFSLYVIRIISS
jgi:hypothetical protein